MNKSDINISLGSADLAYSRTGTAFIKQSTCSITGVTCLCVCIDGSEGEYGEMHISIDHINFKLKQHGLKD